MLLPESVAAGVRLQAAASSCCCCAACGLFFEWLVTAVRWRDCRQPVAQVVPSFPYGASILLASWPAQGTCNRYSTALFLPGVVCASCCDMSAPVLISKLVHPALLCKAHQAPLPRHDNVTAPTTPCNLYCCLLVLRLMAAALLSGGFVSGVHVCTSHLVDWFVFAKRSFFVATCCCFVGIAGMLWGFSPQGASNIPNCCKKGSGAHVCGRC